MGRKMKTIYEYFSEYSEELINEVLSELANEEKIIVLARYGDDLHNPVTGDNFSEEMSKKFYKNIIPKIRRGLINKTKNIELRKKKNRFGSNFGFNSDLNFELISMLNDDGISSMELCRELNINREQLYNELLKLKNNGIMVKRKYYSDGTISYCNASSLIDLKEVKGMDQNRTIITDAKEYGMKILVISDLHFGNNLERIDIINRVYNYCSKRGINIILCGGDLMDGSFTQGIQKINDLYKQVEYFLKNYPYDENILTFSVLGDHDNSIFKEIGLDIMETFNNLRHDIIVGEFGNMGINIKNDKIHLYHKNYGDESRKFGAPLVLQGHTHKFSTGIFKDHLRITIPTLSNIMQLMPTALELDINFNKGYISNLIVKQIYFGVEDIVLNELYFNLLNGRNVNSGLVKNVEDYKEKKLTRKLD